MLKSSSRKRVDALQQVPARCRDVATSSMERVPSMHPLIHPSRRPSVHPTDLSIHPILDFVRSTTGEAEGRGVRGLRRSQERQARAGAQRTNPNQSRAARSFPSLARAVLFERTGAPARKASTGRPIYQIPSPAGLAARCLLPPQAELRSLGEQLGTATAAMAQAAEQEDYDRCMVLKQTLAGLRAQLATFGVCVRRTRRRRRRRR